MFRLPLYGIRIVDLTMAWAGPYATRLLADMGAEVIKIEAIKHWDFIRTYTGQAPSVERVWNKSPYFNAINRNKYGLSLDLRDPQGRDLFFRLVAQSDVVIENFRSEVMDNLGLGFDQLQNAKSDIILVSMPAHGKAGPEKDYIAYGTNVEQLSGLCYLTGYREGPPQKTGISYGDPMAGIAAAGAVALALWHRRRTGRGQYIEVAQRKNLINIIGEYILGYSMSGREPPRLGNRHPSIAPHGCYPCIGDDQWVTLACEDDEQFAALCEVIGQTQLSQEERFADVVSRYRNQDALDEIIAAWAQQLRKEEVAEALQAAGVPAAPVLYIPEVFADPQLRARGFFEPVAQADAGIWEMDGPSWRMSETPGHIRLPPPCFGEHNDYVLHHLLGLSEGEIEKLKQESVTDDMPDWSVHE